jgi:penicillin amidase
MKALQNDVLGVKARMVLPLMLDRLSLRDSSAAEARALDRLRTWEYRYEPDKKAPVIFELWWEEFYQTLWDEFDRDSVPLPVPHSANTIHLLKEGEATAFYDRTDTPETEDLPDLIRGAYRRAVDSLRAVEARTESSVSWWRFKGTSIRHLLRIPSFGTQDLRIGGDQGIVNAAGSRAAPSWRMVVELGKEIRAWGVFPGGQSGNPGSPYYDHMVDEWAEGDYFRLIFEPEDAFPEDAIFRTVTFEPGES